MVSTLSKRKRTSDSHDDRTQMRRKTGNTTVEEPTLDQEVKYIQAMRKRPIPHLKDIDYGSVLDDLNFVDGSNPGESVSYSTLRIRDKSRAVESLWSQLASRLGEHRATMTHLSTEFRKNVTASQGWYLNGNVLLMPYTRLMQCFQATNIGDGRQFYEYLCSILRWRQYKDPKDFRKIEEQFTEKALFLVSLITRSQQHLTTLEKQGANYRYFHALVLLAAEAFRPDLHKVGVEYFKEVQRLILKCSAEPRVIGSRCEAQAHPRYWDFARARRRLWTAWPRVSCSTARERFAGGGTCWHVSAHELLLYIQEQASAEVRRSVTLAVGSKLPAELVEHIFESTMAAEECPVGQHICTANPGEEKMLFDMIDESVTIEYVQPNGIKGCKLSPACEFGDAIYQYRTGDSGLSVGYLTASRLARQFVCIATDSV